MPDTENVPVRNLRIFAIHVLVWAVGTVLCSLLLIFVFSSVLPKGENVLFDFPYSPLFWGPLLVIGFLVNNIMRHNSGQWVWVIGVLWLASSIASTLRGYDPRWCLGCSASQYVWHSYFTYGDSYEEGLGLVFGTTPMLNSVAYSIGAALGMRSRWPLSVRIARSSN